MERDQGMSALLCLSCLMQRFNGHTNLIDEILVSHASDNVHAETKGKPAKFSLCERRLCLSLFPETVKPFPLSFPLITFIIGYSDNKLGEGLLSHRERPNSGLI